MERYQGDYPQQQGQRGRQSDPSRMDPSMGQTGQQGQGQQGQWDQGPQGQGQGQQGQWSQSQPQQGTGQYQYGYGRDDDFSPPAEQDTSGGGEYGSRSGLGYGSGATGARGAASDYDTSQYQQQQQQQQPQQGEHKPGIGQRMMGKAEKAFGKMTGDQEKVQRGQERQGGQQY